MTTMRYKDYEATVEYDEDAEIFHGEVGDLRDVITFQGKSVAALKKAFADSIEDYLAFCKARGREPEQVRRVCPGKSRPPMGSSGSN